MRRRPQTQKALPTGQEMADQRGSNRENGGADT